MLIPSVTQYTIGEIVANDFRTASIFKDAGIDFCCGGNKSITDACHEKGVDVEQIMQQLALLSQTTVSSSMNFNDWELPFLCDYIVQTHHKYVIGNLPELIFYTQKIASVHSEHHPELVEVERLFAQVNAELLQHLKKEEEVLFPAIKKTTSHPSLEINATIISEIKRMQREHELAGGAMDKINVLTHHYLIPEDACNTYRVALKLLEQFEDDLHVHVHLENNILYPKSLKLAE